MGLMWPIITPVLMLSVYTFVFGVIFKTRWTHEVGSGSLAEFALTVFAGQIAFQIFAECASRSPGLILGVPNFVKKVVFPLEILPVAVLGGAIYHAGISICIALAASILIQGQASLTAVLLPLSLFPVAILALGTAWILAALGVFFRDISQIVGIVIQILFFCTPIFYPLTVVPEPYRSIMSWNPLVSMVDLFRGHLIYGSYGESKLWLISYSSGLFALIIGYACFQKTRKGFADVI